MGNDQLIDSLGPLYNREFVPFFTNQYSLHDIMRYCLEFTGPADVMLSTFSLSESAIREIINMQEDDLLLSLTMVLDHTVRKNKLDMLLFASENFRIVMADVHAKIVTISNRYADMVIISSGNLNTIKRYETGLIIVNNNIANFYNNALKDLAANSTPFEL